MNLALLKDLTALNGIGGSIFDYFTDLGIKEVALYGNSELVPIVWSQGYWSKVKVKHVFGAEAKKYTVNVGERTRSNVLQGSDQAPGTDMPIILLDKPATRLPNSFDAAKLINYSRVKHMLLEKVINYKQTQQPNIQLYLLGLPLTGNIRNQTSLDKEYMNNWAKLSEADKLKQWRAILVDQLGQSTEYVDHIRKYARIDTVRNEEGISFLKDVTSPYVNVKNGYRVVLNAPEKANRNIYTFGNSWLTGHYTDDHNTISNVVQDVMNDYYGPESVRVINAANGGHPNFYRMWQSFEYHAPKDDDMIVFGFWVNELFFDNPLFKEHFTLINPQKEVRLFDRPHTYGQLMWLDKLHPTFIGYKKVGEYLGEKLIELNENNDTQIAVAQFIEKWTVSLSIENATLNRHWSVRKFKQRDYLDFIRTQALSEKENKVGRWLAFDLEAPLEVGKVYQVKLTMRYSDNTTFVPLLHSDELVSERLQAKVLNANQWQTFTFDVVPNKEGNTHFGFTATHFMSPGSILSIKDIQIIAK